MAAYVEGTGLGPHESARLRVDSSGKIRIMSGAASQGQGHETTLAQVAADALGMPMEDITRAAPAIRPACRTASARSRAASARSPVAR